MSELFLIILLIILFILSLILILYITSDKFKNFNSNVKIEKFLSQYSGKNVILIPFDGNSGDALILFGTITLLDKLNIKFKFGNINTNYNNEVILINGGGNLVGIYSDVKKIIEKYQHNNKIILLPHTIKDEDKLLNNLSSNTIIFCREFKSYNYVKKMAKYPNNIYLDHDMAFQIKNLEKFNRKGNGIANCYRIDAEKTNIVIPCDNNDISNTINHYLQLKDKNINKQIVTEFLQYLSNFEEINTNRLHVAIGSSLLGKKVNFYGNSYWKNKSIYEFSIKDKFKNTKFLK